MVGKIIDVEIDGRVISGEVIKEDQEAVYIDTDTGIKKVLSILDVNSLMLLVLTTKQMLLLNSQLPQKNHHFSILLILLQQNLINQLNAKVV